MGTPCQKVNVAWSQVLDGTWAGKVLLTSLDGYKKPIFTLHIKQGMRIFVEKLIPCTIIEKLLHNPGTLIKRLCLKCNPNGSTPIFVSSLNNAYYKYELPL